MSQIQEERSKKIKKYDSLILEKGKDSEDVKKLENEIETIFFNRGHEQRTKIKNSIGLVVEDNELKNLCLKYGFGRTVHRGTQNIQQGGDKAFHGYTTRYYHHFKEFKNDKINFLEIGIFQGRSLAMWNDFFTNGSIYGIDIKLDEFNLFKKELQIMGAFKDKDVIVGEANTKETVLFQDVEFDFILDDGCHKPESQIETFKNYYPLLKKGGLYIIEDLRGANHEVILGNFFNNYNIIVYQPKAIIIIQK